jgi:hypothetical protein
MKKKMYFIIIIVGGLYCIKIKGKEEFDSKKLN